MLKRVFIGLLLFGAGCGIGFYYGLGLSKGEEVSYLPAANEQAETLGEASSVEVEENGKIMIVGDVMLGRSVNAISERNQDHEKVFENVGELIKEADIAIGNLEGPLVDDCPITDEGMIFCGSERWASILSEAGFDVVSLANNHSTNYEEEGLLNTIEVLEQNGVSSVGVGDGIIKTVNGIRVGILAYNDVGKYPYVKNADDEVVRQEIINMKTKSDVVIVYYHWGTEYTDEPSVRQKTLAKLSSESGADVVVGTHPHWVQTSEWMDDTLVIYSLGNFVFDQMWSEETRKGEVAIIEVESGGVSDYKTIPITIDGYRIPELVR